MMTRKSDRKTAEFGQNPDATNVGDEVNSDEGFNRQLAKFEALFDGFSGKHIEFVRTGTKANGKKEGHCLAVKGPPNFAEHLRGEGPAHGVYLIRNDGETVVFGAIDIDDYGIDHASLEVDWQQLPLVIVKSESGGAHLYLFCKEPVPAELVRRRLSEFAAAIGYAHSEVFPKQDRRNKGDTGSGIIVPYHGSSRRCFHDGKLRDLEYFLNLANQRRIDKKYLNAVRVVSEVPFSDGPPCLQTLAARGIGEGMRNDVLANIAIYLRKKSPDTWEEDLADINHGLENALSSKELRNIVSSYKKKRYYYACKRAPLKPVCDKEECLRRKFGVGGNGKIDDTIAEINKEFAVTWAGSEVVILREHFDRELGRETVDFVKKDHVRIWYQNQMVIDERRPRNPIDVWLEHPRRRQFSEVLFAPGIEISEAYNLWRGWAVDPNSRASCDRFLAHTREIVCSGNVEYFRWVMAWMADAIQNPNKKPGTAIVLRGREGTGKGLFVQYLARLYGEHFVHLIDSERLVGRFNAYLKGAALVYADEAFFAGDARHGGKLKGLITENTILVEMKYINAFPVANRVRLIMASNEEWVVPAGPDARRFFVLNVSDAKKDDTAYWSALVDEMEGGGDAALMHYLINYDISGIDLRNPPKTDALMDQKHLTMKPTQRWWYERLMDGLINCHVEDVVDEGRKWRSPEMDSGLGKRFYWIPREEFRTYFYSDSNLTHDRFRPSPEQFAKQLKSVCPNIAKGERAFTREFQTNDGEAREPKKVWLRAYGIPPLGACRVAFEKFLGHTHDWPEFESDLTEKEDCPF